ncbi:MAG: T9SS type A sorting domain-containing protein [Ferruginibacter sp.]
MQTVPNFTPGKAFQYYDYKPAAGENYYRLKCIGQNNEVEYSTSVMVITGAAGSNWIMYPVPVRDMLTLQYKGLKKITGVVNVFIRNITGRIITRVRSASLNTTIQIPVGNLGSGIYDVQIIIEDEVVWNQRFVK